MTDLSPPPNTNAIEEKEVMETTICMCLYKKIYLFRSINPAGLALLALGLFAIAGCSSGSTASRSKLQVGAVTFTDVNAKVQTSLQSLTVSQGTYLDVTLTNDMQLLGADWSVSCGSAPPPGTPLPPGQTQDESCGTFTPAHTMSGPVPSFATSAAGYVVFYTAPAVTPKEGTVTLYASATSDHTKFSSVTLTINGLPISVGFAPAPPSTLGMSASTQLKAVLNNDSTGAGVNWTAICGASACGSFSVAQTASGVVTTYTAPATVPTGGNVKITATSVADPTKSVSATIQILPISISVTPTTLSVGTADTESLTALVVNDGANKGADWSVSCTNTTTPGNCGTITSHTASGATATYTAPSLANIAVGSTVVITATSTTDPTNSATATITTLKGDLVSGRSQAAQQPIRGAFVSLYAATTGATVLNGVVNASNASAITSATTDSNGNFVIPYGYECPTPDAQMYLVSTGGNAGGGTNPDLALMSALGSCANLDSSRFVVNEATTVAAVYALSELMTDYQHVGSPSASPAGAVAAFATAADLVDVTTGLPRPRTVSGLGIVPQDRINTLANVLHACAVTAGSAPGDGTVCDQLFTATNPGSTPATRASNQIQAMLEVSRGTGEHIDNVALYNLARSGGSFQPMLGVQPMDWTVPVTFSEARVGAVDKVVIADSAGNIWVRRDESGAIEFVGAAASALDPNTLIHLASTMAKTQP